MKPIFTPIRTQIKKMMNVIKAVHVILKGRRRIPAPHSKTVNLCRVEAQA